MANGMSFIGNRWVFTGPQSYVVEPNLHGTGWLVVSVNAAGRRPVAAVTERSKAQEMAAILNDRH